MNEIQNNHIVPESLSADHAVIFPLFQGLSNVEYLNAIDSVIGAKNIHSIYRSDSYVKIYLKSKTFVSEIVKSNINIKGSRPLISDTRIDSTVILSRIDPTIPDSCIENLLQSYGILKSTIRRQKLSNNEDFSHIISGDVQVSIEIFSGLKIPKCLKFMYDGVEHKIFSRTIIPSLANNLTINRVPKYLNCSYKNSAFVKRTTRSVYDFTPENADINPTGDNPRKSASKFLKSKTSHLNNRFKSSTCSQFKENVTNPACTFSYKSVRNNVPVKESSLTFKNSPPRKEKAAHKNEDNQIIFNADALLKEHNKSDLLSSCTPKISFPFNINSICCKNFSNNSYVSKFWEEEVRDLMKSFTSEENTVKTNKHEDIKSMHYKNKVHCSFVSQNNDSVVFDADLNVIKISETKLDKKVSFYKRSQNRIEKLNSCKNIAKSSKSNVVGRANSALSYNPVKSTSKSNKRTFAPSFKNNCLEEKSSLISSAIENKIQLRSRSCKQMQSSVQPKMSNKEHKTSGVGLNAKTTVNNLKSPRIHKSCNKIFTRSITLKRKTTSSFSNQKDCSAESKMFCRKRQKTLSTSKSSDSLRNTVRKVKKFIKSEASSSIPEKNKSTLKEIQLPNSENHCISQNKFCLDPNKIFAQSDRLPSFVENRSSSDLLDLGNLTSNELTMAKSVLKTNNADNGRASSLISSHSCVSLHSNSFHLQSTSNKELGKIIESHENDGYTKRTLDFDPSSKDEINEQICNQKLTKESSVNFNDEVFMPKPIAETAVIDVINIVRPSNQNSANCSQMSDKNILVQEANKYPLSEAVLEDEQLFNNCFEADNVKIASNDITKNKVTRQYTVSEDNTKSSSIDNAKEMEVFSANLISKELVESFSTELESEINERTSSNMHEVSKSLSLKIKKTKSLIDKINSRKQHRNKRKFASLECETIHEGIRSLESTNPVKTICTEEKNKFSNDNNHVRLIKKCYTSPKKIYRNKKEINNLSNDKMLNSNDISSTVISYDKNSESILNESKSTNYEVEDDAINSVVSVQTTCELSTPVSSSPKITKSVTKIVNLKKRSSSTPESNNLDMKNSLSKYISVDGKEHNDLGVQENSELLIPATSLKESPSINKNSNKKSISIAKNSDIPVEISYATSLSVDVYENTEVSNTKKTKQLISASSPLEITINFSENPEKISDPVENASDSVENSKSKQYSVDEKELSVINIQGNCQLRKYVPSTCKITESPCKNSDSLVMLSDVAGNVHIVDEDNKEPHTLFKKKKNSMSCVQEYCEGPITRSSSFLLSKNSSKSFNSKKMPCDIAENRYEDKENSITVEGENHCVLIDQENSLCLKNTSDTKEVAENPSKTDSSLKNSSYADQVLGALDDVTEEFDFSLPENTINEIDSYLQVDLPNDDINNNEKNNLNIKDADINSQSLLKKDELFSLNQSANTILPPDISEKEFGHELYDISSLNEENKKIPNNHVSDISVVDDKISYNQESFPNLIISDVTGNNCSSEIPSDIEYHISVQTFPSTNSLNSNSSINCFNEFDNLQDLREEPAINNLQIKISNLSSISNKEPNCDFKILSDSDVNKNLYGELEQSGETIVIKKEYPEPLEESVTHFSNISISNKTQVPLSKTKNVSELHRKKVEKLNSYIQHIRALQRKKLFNKNNSTILNNLNNNSSSEPSPYDFEESEDTMISLENLRLNKFKKSKNHSIPTKKPAPKPVIPCVVLFKDKNNCREKWRVKMRIPDQEHKSNDTNKRKISAASPESKHKTLKSHKKSKNSSVVTNKQIPSVTSLKIKIGQTPQESTSSSLENVSLKEYCATNGFEIVDSINVESDCNELSSNNITNSLQADEQCWNSDAFDGSLNDSSVFSGPRNEINCSTASQITSCHDISVPCESISKDLNLSYCDQNNDLQAEEDSCDTNSIFKTYVAKSEEIKPVYEDIYSYPIVTLSDSDDESSLSNFPLRKEELVNFLNEVKRQKNPRTYALKVLSENKAPGSLRALVLQLYGYFKVCRNRAKKLRISRLIRALDDRYARH